MGNVQKLFKENKFFSVCLLMTIMFFTSMSFSYPYYMYNYLFLHLEIASIFLLVVFSWNKFTKRLAGVDRKYWIILIFVLALTNTVLIPYSNIFIERDHVSYANDAVRMLTEEGGGYFNHMGYPYLLSLLFSIGGANMFYAKLLILLFFNISIILIFVFSYTLFEDELAAIYSSILWIFFPNLGIHLIFNINSLVSGVFLLLSSFIAVISYKEKDGVLYVLALILSFFTMLMRPEMFMVIPLFFLGFLLFQKRYDKKALNKLIPSIILFVILLVFIFYPYMNAVLENRVTIGSSRAKFLESIGTGTGNDDMLESITSGIFSTRFMFSRGMDSLELSYIVFLLILLSCNLIFVLKRKRTREIAYLALVILTFNLVYILSWQVYDHRYLIVILPLICTLSGMCLGAIKEFCRSFWTERKSTIIYATVLVVIILFLAMTTSTEIDKHGDMEKYIHSIEEMSSIGKEHLLVITEDDLIAVLNFNGFVNLFSIEGEIYRYGGAMGMTEYDEIIFIETYSENETLSGELISHVIQNLKSNLNGTGKAYFMEALEHDNLNNDVMLLTRENIIKFLQNEYDFTLVKKTDNLALYEIRGWK